jgi:hypothetical protein
MDTFLGLATGAAFGLMAVYPVHAVLIMGVVFYSLIARD